MNIATASAIIIRRAATAPWAIAGILIMVVVGMSACSGGLVEPNAAMNPTSGSDHTPQRLEFIAPAMGMQARIVMHADDPVVAKAAAKAAFNEIARLDAILSDWRDDSHVAKVNLEAGGLAVQVDDVFIELVERSRQISEATGGAFDVTIGPVTRLWREARERHATPEQSKIDAAHALVDWRLIEIDPEYRTIRLPQPGMRLDFGGIGKGFAADRALAILAEKGFPQSLVALEGDLAIGAAPPGQAGWRIAIADGLTPPSAGETAAALILHNCGVSTSGDIEQSIAIDGVQQSHIIHPHEGLGLTARIAATVIAPDATTADALATAACVLGPERGVAAVESVEGAMARVVTLVRDVPRVAQSPAFAGVATDG
jgi:thiamine biosynthesis lipoprotein